MRLGDLNRASELVESELQQSLDRGSSAETWNLSLAHAEILRLRGHTEEALEYLADCEASLSSASEDIVSLAGLKMNRGYCLGHLGRYPAAHALLNEAERLARDAGLLELQCEVHQRQAMIFYLQQDYVSSDRIFRLILDASARLGGWYFRANALWGIGKNLMIQKHYLEAMPWLEDSLTHFESVGARLSMATVWSELAVCHLGLGDDRKSLELLEKSLDENRKAGTKHNYLVGLANIGNVYLHREDYLRAIDYYRRALDLAREIKDPVSIQKWSYNMRLAYARLRESVDRLDSKTA